MATSKATARWEGSLKAGSGVMHPAHGPEVAFSVATRFEGKTGSNPEELVGAALAGCFSMALASNLEKAGAAPKQIKTDASVKIEKLGDGFTITAIELTTEADVPGMDADKFRAIADATKKGCPVSKALAAVESITLSAKLTSG